MSPPGTLVDNVDIHGDETVAVYNSVESSYDVCAHCGDWRRVQLVRIRILARGDTNSDQVTLHRHYPSYDHMTD